MKESNSFFKNLIVSALGRDVGDGYEVQQLLFVGQDALGNVLLMRHPYEIGVASQFAATKCEILGISERINQVLLVPNPKDSCDQIFIAHKLSRPHPTLYHTAPISPYSGIAIEFSNDGAMGFPAHLLHGGFPTPGV